MSAQSRAQRLAALVADQELDQLLVGDLVRLGDSGPDAIASVRWLTGFSGTSGLAIVGGEDRLFLTDFRYTERAGREVIPQSIIDIPRLARMAQDMVRQALDAFVRRDAALARQVIARDDEVDMLTEQSFRELLTYMLEDSRNISRAIRLTFVGKYFERMADAATNICEMVVYLVEGRMIKHSAENS